MKTYVIAEIGSNWEGNITKAKKLIHLSKKAGADAVKFQIWRAEDLYSKKHPESKNIKKSQLNVVKIKLVKEYFLRQDLVQWVMDCHLQLVLVLQIIKNLFF